MVGIFHFVSDGQSQSRPKLGPYVHLLDKGTLVGDECGKDPLTSPVAIIKIAGVMTLAQSDEEFYIKWGPSTKDHPVFSGVEQ